MLASPAALPGASHVLPRLAPVSFPQATPACHHNYHALRTLLSSLLRCGSAWCGLACCVYVPPSEAEVVLPQLPCAPREGDWGGPTDVSYDSLQFIIELVSTAEIHTLLIHVIKAVISLSLLFPSTSLCQLLHFEVVLSHLYY